jgi:DNA-directed RNA polymerase subunit RPC12/RpoP
MSSYQYWYVCRRCNETVIRHSNAQKCLKPKCGGKLIRGERATAEEVKAQVDEALRKHREIPE